MTNFADSLWGYADSAARRPALRCGEDLWTYGRLREGIAGFAGALREQGLGPGQRAILIAPTVPEFAVAYYGMLTAGVAVVAMNPMATTREIEYVLDDAECSLLVAWHESAAASGAVASERGVPFWRLCSGGSGVPEGSPVSSPHAGDGEDTAVILYTSGTTGNPKGAELTHANLYACGNAFSEAFEISANDVFATALPLFHVFGGSVIMGTALMNGAVVELLPRFEAAQALRTISAGGVTVFFGVPTMMNALLHEEFDDPDFSSLRFCSTGGAPLPEEVLRAFQERFGVPLLEGYALTETTGAGTFSGLHRPRKVGFAGVPLPGVEVRVVGPEGGEVLSGEIGEVLLRGPMLMKGYYGNPEATEKTIRDGWLYSGDLGSQDADGDLRIVDRKKDMVIRGGYNVYPLEVEQVLYMHPDVVEAAVVGVADEHFGEEIAVAVVVRPGSELDAGTLYGWLRERLSAYKVPRLFQFADELPKGTTGKILKRQLSLENLVDGRTARVRADG